MTDETAEPTTEDRVAELESTVATLSQGLDSAKTANDVLQTRYGALSGMIATLTDTITALTARLDAQQPA